MRGYSLSTQYGNIRSGQYDFIATPGVQRRATTKYPAILCHGSGTPYEFVYPTSFGSISLGANLAIQGGIPWIASENDDQAWGNAQAMSDLDAQVTLAASKFGTPSGKCVLVGVSMGGLTAVRYAILNPSKVAAVVGIIPLTNLVGFYNRNTGSSDATSTSTAAQVASAWGVAAPQAFSDLVTNGTTTVTSASAAFTSAINGKVLWAASTVPVGATLTYVNATTATLSVSATGSGSGIKAGILTALGSGSDVQSLASTLTVPTTFYYSSADTTVLPADTTAFAAAANGGAGITAIHNVGANGHSEQTILDAQNYNGTLAADIIAFLQANGA
ncbi:MAG: hypothetical protein NVS3B21_29450 [Acidimicrobiales bacterium]